MSVKFGSAVVCRTGLFVCAVACSHLFSQTAFAQDRQTFDSPEAAAAEPSFQLQGEYTAAGRAVQAVALGEGEYDVSLLEGGLPGAGWDRSPPRKQTLDDEQLQELIESGGYQKIVRKSPTLGAKPPAGAVVLFDGSRESLQANWDSGARLTDDGLLMEGATSLPQFESYTLHLEFRTPFMPNARGQGRGNSGVYHQGRFETQILDSFGLDGKMNETGGLYSIKAPDLNMCLPPLSWQTYDVDFTAASFNAVGEKLSNPRITVRLNGVVVQQDVELPGPTAAAPLGGIASSGPIFLQNHGNPVRFRNIWVKPRDLARESRRPLLPAFDRLFASGEPSPLGGQLLVSELGCTNCHASPNELVGVRQAPILSDVGKRVQASYLLDYLQDPHAVKPGTTMPDVLAHLTAPEKEQAATAIASFLLASTGKSAERRGDPRSVSRGESLFHTIGCTACHASERTPGLDATSVPLGKLADKYVLDGLALFLQQPHTIRPSGRMPTFGLTPEQAMDVATYLLRDAVIGAGTLNVRGQFFSGSWDSLPDFDSLEPYSEATCFDFDIAASGKTSDFAARFTTLFVAPNEGTYRFHVGSDDGSRLFIDDELVVDNDGIHPFQFKSADATLSAGVHAVRVEYFEKGGEEVLQVDIEGPGMLRTSLGAIATLDPEGPKDVETQDRKFDGAPSLVAMGRSLFQSTGCAACHELRIDGQLLESTVQSAVAVKALSAADPSRGCMADEPLGKAPRYELSPAQQAAIGSFISSGSLGSGSLGSEAADRLHFRMASLNCYACHTRGGVGGPELARDAEFQTRMKEMGDEGRLPPSLNGAGDKLQRQYIESIVASGVNERPYMLVNMPGFGASNAAEITELLTGLDEKTTPLVDRPSVTDDKLKSDGRLLVGDKGLSCVKCHTFGGRGAPGIQAIDMQRMTTRLRENWFHRYLMSPTTYRPGTRMPASFPDGKSVLPDLYDGLPGQQIHAMWDYLADGARAREPIGVQQQLIELLPAERPIIYRNFIEGLTPRGIAVGYPENVHLAWDANRMSLALLWKGAFVDASRHWVGRGPGNQGPLGDEVLSVERQAPLARLDSPTTPWPTVDSDGLKFLGYRLNDQGQPTFRYRLRAVTVEDQPLPRADASSGVAIRRQLKLSGNLQSLYFRAAVGETIEPQGEGWYRVNGRYSVRVSGEATLRQSDQQTELIVNLGDDQQATTIDQETITIDQEIVW